MNATGMRSMRPEGQPSPVAERADLQPLLCPDRLRLHRRCLAEACKRKDKKGCEAQPPCWKCRVNRAAIAAALPACADSAVGNTCLSNDVSSSSLRWTADDHTPILCVVIGVSFIWGEKKRGGGGPLSVERTLEPLVSHTGVGDERDSKYVV